MDALSVAKTLHPLEVRILLAYEAGSEIDASKVRAELGYREGQENQAFSWLLGKGLISETARSSSTFFELTPLGGEFASAGTPEARIFSLLSSRGPARLPELAEALGFDQKTIGSAFGILSKAGAAAMDTEKRAFRVENAVLPPRTVLLQILLERAQAAGGILEEQSLSADELEVMRSVAKKRGAGDAPFRVAERERVVYRLVENTVEVRKALISLGLTGEELGALTPSMLEKGSWRQGSFRPYNIGVTPARSIPGRKNPYVEFLESVKDKLVSLGFEEFDGNMVETEFWNSDALFMPQFHSARDIHDVYHVESPRMAQFIEEPHLSNIAAAH